MSRSTASTTARDTGIPTEARIRQAAVTLFARRGYGATGIRDIAREAGMNSATLYHYTSSKEELLVKIMVDGQVALNEAAESELTGVEHPAERLGLLVGSLVGAHATNPLSTRVIDTEIRSLGAGSPGRQRVIELRDHYEQLWSSALEDGRSLGVLDVGDAHVTRLALLTMCTGMSNWYQPGAGVDLDELVRDFVDLALGAVRARGKDGVLTAADIPSIDFNRVPRLLSEPAHQDSNRT